MEKNFWTTQINAKPRGLVVLAPMADVTDNPFRRILREIGAPDIFWNEFISADGLVHPEARPKLEKMLSYEDDQRPIIAQIFSGEADNCRKAAEICREHGFDGVDINMGCPARNIIKQVSGSELSKIEHRERVSRIITETRKGAGDIPVSVKTRLGFNTIDESWIVFLLEHQLPCLTVHLRTKQEMSKVRAHWEIIDNLIALRDRISPDTVLIANGDVQDRQEAYARLEEHPGLNGVMIGRGVLTNPWAFADKAKEEQENIVRRLELALKHTQYFLEEYTVDGVLTKNFNLMKKFYKLYVQGFDGAKELRIELMQAKDFQEVKLITARFIGNSI